jgi:ADP-ribosylglycohydrolase
VERKVFDVEAVREAYCSWLDSGPFDCGATVASGLTGRPDPDSQANGAMMRVSPLGIFGAGRDLEEVGEWARRDAALTHPNAVCMEANRLYVMAIARAIWEGPTAEELFETILQWAGERGVPQSLVVAVERAHSARPADYVRQQGWVLIAFGNALWQLRHAGDLEEAVVDTVMQGGDTDTNAAICGALLGAVYGREAIPEQWVERLVGCRPDARSPRPRPERFWPADCLGLAMRLCDGS